MSDITVIAIYGFFKNFCPDGFYMSNILFGPGKNFTVAETTQDVISVMAYSNLLLTLIALLITDVLQYKTLIITGAVAAVASKGLLYWGTAIFHLQLMQFLYGVYKAAQVAYRTYVYTKVQKHSYQRVTAIVHITPKLGTLTSAVVAQLLISTKLAGMGTLMQISLGGLCTALLTAILLPTVEGTAFCPDPKSPTNQGITTTFGRYQRAAELLWSEFTSACSNPYVVKWCIWWIVATGAVQLVQDYYVQALWDDISGENKSTYNAGVDAVYATISSVVCFITGRLKVNWHFHGDLVFALCALAKGAALLVCAQTSHILTAYALYIGISTLYDMMTVISNSQVAMQVKNDSFGLIFGINTFLSIVFQAVLTYILTSKNALALPIRCQFEAVACCFVALGLGCLITAAYKMCCSPSKVHVEKDKSVAVVNSNGVVKLIICNDSENKS